jgi:hypothetical protein
MNNGTTKKHLPGLGERVKQIRHRQGLSLQVAATRGHHPTDPRPTRAV